jgi:uncharacterized protein (DUF2141 family)
MKKVFLLFFLIILSSAVSAQNENQPLKSETGTLLVLVRGFKSTEGRLMVALFNNAKEFEQKLNPFIGDITAISANEELIRFENVPYGDYAVVAIHDINKDGTLDKNVLGIPTEGYGFSNNVMDKFGPPTFLQASFVFSGRDEVKIIDLQYGIPK